MTSLLESSQIGIAGDEIWREVIASDELAKELQSFCALFVKEFIAKLWYSYITNDVELEHEAENKLALVLAIVVERIRKIDAGKFVTRYAGT